MSFRPALFAICAVMGAGCGSAAEPLDSFIAFSDPVRCTPSKELNDLLNSVLSHEEEGGVFVVTLAKRPVPQALVGRVGEPRLEFDGRKYSATVPIHGTWQGLPLRALVITGWIESEEGFSLIFEASRTEVIRAANRVGFRLPPSGRVYLDDDVMGMGIGVADHPAGGTELYCMPG